MATIKISELPAILGANTATTDVLPIVDTSLSTTNKITREEFFKNIASADINGGTIDGTVIGGSSAAAGTFTTVTASGDVTIADKIVHAGDTNTAIRFPAADTVTVETSGTERVRINSSGNVGIGTSSPDNLMTLQTSTYADAFVPIANLRYSTFDVVKLGFTGSGGSIRTGTIDTGSFGFAVNTGGGTERMRITSAGNVGIGTSSPDARLRVAGAVNSLQARFSNVDGRGLAISTFSSVSTNDNGVIYNAGVFADAQHVWQCGGTERMRINASGNVGIGTSSPTVALDVVGRIRMTDTAMILRSTGDVSTTGIGYLSLRDSDNVERGYVGFGAGNGSVTLANLTANPITFLTNSAERMRITSAGNVGIGVIPSAWSGANVLEVGRQGTALLAFSANNSQFTSNAYYNGTNWLYAASSTASYYQQNAGQHRFYNATSGTAGNTITWTERMTLDASGNLLLGGTASPASATASLAIFNGTAPTGSVTNGVVLYAEDVSSSSELKVRDEAGNVTTLSPHNFDLIPEGPSEDMAWSYYSERDGKRINVDMLKAIRLLESITGEKLVHIV